MNTSVSFEIAKTLKEIGFDKKVKPFYNGLKGNELQVDDMIGTANNLPNWYPAPTIAEVVMWLYEKHGIWIEVRRWRYKSNTVNTILKKKGFEYVIKGVTVEIPYDSPTEAYEAAILAILKNLI